MKMSPVIRELNHRRGSYWNVLQMIRWTLVSVILVCLRDLNSLQIILNNILSFIFQGLILNYRPLETRIENIFLFFNELTVSLYLYFLIPLSDFNQHSEHFNGLGMCLLSVVIVALGVNFLKFFVNLICSIFRFIKYCICKCRRRQNVVAKKYENIDADQTFG